MSFERLLVTGATGFLGKALVETLALRQVRLTALGLRTRSLPPFGPGVEYLAGDLADPASSRSLLFPWRWDAVINLAGPVPGKAADDGFLSAHVNIALNLALALPQGWAGRLIHASSMTVYGLPRSLPMAEDHPRCPESGYGQAKALSEDVLAAVCAKEGFDLWSLRLPGLFSEGRSSGALFHFITAAIEGQELKLTAKQPTPWDVLHVSDAVEALVRVLDCPESHPGPVNISYGEPVELAAMARKIASRGGCAVHELASVRHPIVQLDTSKAKRLLGWTPASLEARLEHLWNTTAAAGKK